MLPHAINYVQSSYSRARHLGAELERAFLNNLVHNNSKKLTKEVNKTSLYLIPGEIHHSILVRVQCAECGPRARVPQLDRLLVVFAPGGDHTLKWCLT